VWWVDFGEPGGSEPGYSRPVVVVQSDDFNHTALRTTLVVALTTNLRMATLPGNVLVSRRRSGLTKDSVANISQIATVDKEFLRDRSGRLTPEIMAEISEGIRLVLSVK